ncbi:hypothetical protein GO009_06965 [Muricauda sp. TY007]|uniref:hypothetical protein n=1 Tax=Allomuricauda sp. TY007 TaxID=2683200 RepID=UPI0013C25684|nr:hypothetical protein [Muricauda sp. TY007]NDV15764.1 hypothetical protein [Muricauda sp. TY007]
MKRPSILMLITFLFGICIVLALHIAAPKKENHKHAGFERLFAPEGFIQPIDTLDLGRHGYYFAGTDAGKVFLANRSAVGYVLEINTQNLRDTTYHIINADNLKYKALDVKVNPPYFFLMDGIMPFIYRGSTTNWVATSYIDSTYFVNALPLSDSTFALTKITNFKTSFHKIIKGNKEPEIFPDLLEEQGGEGVFSTYGTIHYDKTNDQLVYVYLYRNEYFTMDTNFNLLSRGNTIDTISQVKIVVDKIASENSLTMSSPPLTVNPKNSVYKGFLFNNSNLLAGNEDPDLFEKASVIDVYHLKDGSYQFSFYIPSLKKKKIKAFRIVENSTLLGLYEHEMVTFKMSKPFKTKNLLTAL